MFACGKARLVLHVPSSIRGLILESLCVPQKRLVLHRSLSGPPRLPLAAHTGAAGQEVEMVDQGAQVNSIAHSEALRWL